MAASIYSIHSSPCWQFAPLPSAAQAGAHAHQERAPAGHAHAQYIVPGKAQWPSCCINRSAFGCPGCPAGRRVGGQAPRPHTCCHGAPPRTPPTRQQPTAGPERWLPGVGAHRLVSATPKGWPARASSAARSCAAAAAEQWTRPSHGRPPGWRPRRLRARLCG
jgi:hypothetical protein